MEGVTLPTPPEGYEYKLLPIKKTRQPMRDKDPSELTPRQLATLRYREKNKEKILEEKRQRYQEKKKQKVSELGTTPS
jgi:hypothetical protein